MYLMTLDRDQWVKQVAMLPYLEPNRGTPTAIAWRYTVRMAPATSSRPTRRVSA